MVGLQGDVGYTLVLGGLVVLVTAVAGWVAVRHARWRGRDPFVAAARPTAWGAGVLLVVATALPTRWPIRHGFGELVLTPGAAGLAQWPLLVADPRSLTALLVVATVVLYATLTFTLRLGWGWSPARTLATALAFAIGIEAWQWLAISRLASVDDVLLALLGAVAGTWAGGAVVWRRPGVEARERVR